MDAQLLIVLAEEKDMVTEYEGYHLVKLQNCVQTAHQKATERIVLLKVVDDDLGGLQIVGVNHHVVVIAESEYGFRKLQVLKVLGGPFVGTVYFLDDFVGDHNVSF